MCCITLLSPDHRGHCRASPQLSGPETLKQSLSCGLVQSTQVKCVVLASGLWTRAQGCSCSLSGDSIWAEKPLTPARDARLCPVWQAGSWGSAGCAAVCARYITCTAALHAFSSLVPFLGTKLAKEGKWTARGAVGCSTRLSQHPPKEDF